MMDARHLAEATARLSRFKKLLRFVTWLHIAVYRLTGGRVGGRVMGLEVLLLTTRGRTTGRRYTTPLYFTRDLEDYAVIASYAGSDTDPGWWKNLQHSPRGEIQLGRRVLWVEAEVAPPERSERVWRHMAALYPAYDDYRRRTSRVIPVVLLKPAG